MDYNLDDIDVTELAKKSGLLARLVEEVRTELASDNIAYNRMHNRHNRSIRPRPIPPPEPDEPTEPPTDRGLQNGP